MKSAYIFFCATSLFFVRILLATNVYAEGTYANIGTGNAADGSNDAINFSQGRVWTIDQYGKYIWLTEKRSDTAQRWAWSNDLGATWSESSESYSFLARASVAYDSINDVLHAIWTADSASDGIIYRRYSITRDGSNNITSIQRVNTNVNLQLDTSASRSLEQPVALWINDGSADGILVALWTKHGTSLNEARASMRVLSMTDADGTAGNWVALDGTGDTFGTDAPAVAADKIFSDTSGQSALSAKVRGGSGSHKDDLYVFVAEEDDSTADEVLGYRATWSLASSNWSGGWTSLGAIGSMGTASGYSLKYQLIVKPVIDTTNDRLYVGWARYKDVTAGDTVSIAYLNSSDSVSSTVDVYSANGTHSYAPTIDIAYDATLDDVYISYIESTTNGSNGSIKYKTYDGSTLSSETVFYTNSTGSAGADGSADIPILYENRSSNNRLLFAFRVNGALPPTAGNPHEIYWGYITLGDAPTPTPATSSTSLGAAGAPVCAMASPGSPVPRIYQTQTLGSNSIKLFFTEGSSPLDRYVIEYGTKKGSYPFTATDIGPHNKGVYIVKALAPLTDYYFRIRAGNGCATGPWSAVILASTSGIFSGPSGPKPAEVQEPSEESTISSDTNDEPQVTQKAPVLMPSPSLAPVGRSNTNKPYIIVAAVAATTLVLVLFLRRMWAHR